MDTRDDYHFLAGNTIPGIEEMLQNVKVVEPRMAIEIFGPRPAYGVKSGILQLNTRDKGGNWMLNVVRAPGTGTHHFSTTRATERGVLTTSTQKIGYLSKERKHS